MSDNIFDLGDDQPFDAHNDDFEMGGGNFEPVPVGHYFCSVDSAEWKTYEDERYIQVTWETLGGEGDQYAGRKIFQKLKVYDSDRDKKVKHRKQLARICDRAGVNLPRDRSLTDEDLMQLTGHQLWLHVLIWQIKNEQTGEVEREGNWVNKVGRDASDAGKSKAAPAKQSGTSASTSDVPF